MWLGSIVGVLAERDNKDAYEVLQRGMAVGMIYFLVSLISLIPVVGEWIKGIFQSIPLLETLFSSLIASGPLFGILIAVFALVFGIVETFFGAAVYKFVDAIDEAIRE